MSRAPPFKIEVLADPEKLAFLMQLQNICGVRVSGYAPKYASAVFTPVDAAADHNPLWKHKSDCAFPSATLNEINAAD